MIMSGWNFEAEPPLVVPACFPILWRWNKLYFVLSFAYSSPGEGLRCPMK
jgi:hypothetical protein